MSKQYTKQEIKDFLQFLGNNYNVNLDFLNKKIEFELNDELREIAEAAGFIFWGNESYRNGRLIDWSTEYDEAFKNYTYILLEYVFNILDEHAFSSDAKQVLANTLDMPE